MLEFLSANLQGSVVMMKRKLLPLISLAFTSSLFALNLPENIAFQLGGFDASQGKSQNIGISGLLGDHFSVTQSNDQNVLLGLGYFRDVTTINNVQLMAGINAFWLANTEVKGKVTQEMLFTNLSYHYSITQYPIYLAGKALFNANVFNACRPITLDLGVGPNILVTSNFHESSLDGITLPDHAFKGQTNVVFSATAGIGIRFEHVLGSLPLEIGYRFFYLGEGQLQKANNLLTNTLKTGNSYANALIISTTT
jgi:hypothetical protein